MLQSLKIVVDIVAENVNRDSADLVFSASISACIANSALSATISTSFNFLSTEVGFAHCHRYCCR